MMGLAGGLSSFVIDNPKKDERASDPISDKRIHFFILRRICFCEVIGNDAEKAVAECVGCRCNRLIISVYLGAACGGFVLLPRKHG